MPDDKPRWSDQHVEELVGNLLRAGVLLAALVVLAGGVLYLLRHGKEPVDLSTFRKEPSELLNPVQIVEFALQGKARGIIQLGLLLLVGTPVARVAFSAFAFYRQRDYTFVAITLLVLAILLFSLFFDHPH